MPMSPSSPSSPTSFSLLIPHMLTSDHSSPQHHHSLASFGHWPNPSRAPPQQPSPSATSLFQAASPPESSVPTPTGHLTNCAITSTLSKFPHNLPHHHLCPSRLACLTNDQLHGPAGDDVTMTHRTQLIERFAMRNAVQSPGHPFPLS